MRKKDDATDAAQLPAVVTQPQLPFPAPRAPDPASGENSVMGAIERITMHYLTINRNVTVDELGPLILNVRSGVTGQAPIGMSGHSPHPLPAMGINALPEPVVPREQSVQYDFIVCLECGKKCRTHLKLHVQRGHGFSWEVYKSRWNLPVEYPHVSEDAQKESRRRMRKAWREGRMTGNTAKAVAR